MTAHRGLLLAGLLLVLLMCRVGLPAAGEDAPAAGREAVMASTPADAATGGVEMAAFVPRYGKRVEGRVAFEDDKKIDLEQPDGSVTGYVKELIPGDIERYHISHLEWVEKGGDLRRGRALDSKEPSVELLQALHAYQQALVLAADPKDRERLDAKVGMVLQLQEAWHNESLRRQELGIMVQEAELLKLEKELTAEKLAALKQQGVEVARLRAEVERLREDDRRIARAFDEISQAVIALEEDIDDLRGFDRVFVTINDFGDLRSDLENLERQVRRLQARVSRSD